MYSVRACASALNYGLTEGPVGCLPWLLASLVAVSHLARDIYFRLRLTKTSENAAYGGIESLLLLLL